MKDNFNHRRWFKDQYLKEANINEEMMSKEDAFKALRDVEANMRGKIDDHYIKLMMKALDSLQADEITAMLDKEANIDEGIFDIERDREGADFFELIDPNSGVLVTGTKQDIMEYLWENTELEIKQIK